VVVEQVLDATLGIAAAQAQLLRLAAPFDARAAQVVYQAVAEIRDDEATEQGPRYGAVLVEDAGVDRLAPASCGVDCG